MLYIRHMGWTIVDRQFLNDLVKGVLLMALNLERLETEVSENTDAVDSAVALLSTLADEIRNAAGDPAAVEAIADKLDSNSQRLAEAVAANTPAEEPTE